MIKVNYIRTRLTKEQRIKVVTDYNNRMKPADIMAKYKIGRATLWRILKTKTEEEEKKPFYEDKTTIIH